MLDNREKGWWYWRTVAWCFGLLLIILPVCIPIAELLLTRSAWSVWSESSRMAWLIISTVGIALSSSLLALGLGSVTAFLLVRTNLVGKSIWGILLGMILFIPLPMLLSGWYIMMQMCDATMPALWPVEARWMGTILLHGLQGLPWVILILGIGLLWIEPELEEEMRLAAPFHRIFHRVILPRCWPFVGMSVLMVSWITWHEIAVTDFFRVHTFAEEVYLQLNSGGKDQSSRAIAATFPWCLVFVTVTLWYMNWWKRRCPPQWPSLGRLQQFSLSSRQTAAQLWMLGIISLLIFVPVVGLLFRMGHQLDGSWSLAHCLSCFSRVFTQQGGVLFQSLLMAGLTGLITGVTVLILAWISRGSARWENLTWWVAALLWTLPGPILGIGLLEYILFLIQVPVGGWLSPWLYSEPSPVPTMWAAWLRFLPLAWLVIWPMVRTLPREWDDLARLEGATPWQRFRLHEFAVLLKPALVIAFGIALLTLGEISATKMVTTPGYLPLSHLVFQQLHSGADAELAALSLTLMMPALFAAFVTGMVILFRYRRQRN
ncbi:MAG: iron ABC transporter permease [Planctomycetia bacterium]|nr:iron ABC transporter permease [Planctomycetia bacterium]